MPSRKRHFLILKDVNEITVVTVPDLVKTTGASEATIRRDIIMLDKEDSIILCGGTTLFNMAKALKEKK